MAAFDCSAANMKLGSLHLSVTRAGKHSKGDRRTAPPASPPAPLHHWGSLGQERDANHGAA